MIHFHFKKTEFPFRTILAFIAIVLSLISVLSIGIHFYRISSEYLEEQNTQIEQKVFTQSLSRFTDGLNRLQTGAQLTVSNNPSDLDSSFYQIYEPTIGQRIRDNLKTSLHKTKLLIKDTWQICYFTEDRTLVADSGYPAIQRTTQRDFLEHFGWNSDTSAIFFPGDPVYTSSTDALKLYEDSILSVCPDPISDSSCNTCCLAVSPDFLSDFINSELSIGVISETGNTIVNQTGFTDEVLLNLCRSDIEKRHIYKTFLTDTNLYFLYCPDTSDLKQQIHTLRMIYFACGLVFFSLSVFLSNKFAQPLIRPLYDLEQRISDFLSDQTSYEEVKAPLFSPENSIFLYLSVSVLSTSLIFSLLSYSYLRQSTKDLLLSNVSASFQQAVSETALSLDNLHDVSLYMVYDNQIQSSLDLSSPLSPEIREETNELMKNIQLIYMFPIDLQLYDKNNTLLASTSNLSPDISSLFDSRQRTARWSPVSHRNRNMLLLYVPIIDLESYKSKGTLALYADELYFSRSLNYFPAQYTVYLHNDDGTVLSSTEKTSIGKLLPESSETEFNLSQPVTNTGLTLTLRCSNLTFANELNNALGNISTFLVFIFVIILILNLIISQYLARQFNKLGEEMAGISIDSLSKSLFSTSIVSEINHTYEAFNIMTERIQTLLNEIILSEKHAHALELEKNQSELLLLQSQINPHFLYNTFETINSVIKSGNANLAVNTLNALADMLRYTTRNHAPEIPVYEEIRYAKLYTQIITVQSANSLRILFSITPEAENKLTMKFLLQPIIENSVLHGLKPKGGIGSICVTGMVADGNVIITVRDDGVGITPDRLKELNTLLHEGGNTNSVGLPNIAGRLHILYGDAASVTLISSPGNGCLCTVIHPVVTKTSLSSNENV